MDCENVRMSCIFDTAAQCKLLVFVGEEVEHALAADEGCCAERDIECFVGTIIVPECLAASLGNSYSQQSCYTWRIKVIQRSVNMPAVKASKVIVIFLWDGIAVEGAVVGVFDLDILEALVGIDKAVSNDLDLRLVRDGFEVWMEDAAFGVEGLAVAVLRGGGVEALGEFVLRFRGEMVLVLNHYNEVFIQGIAYYCEDVVWMC